MLKLVVIDDHPVYRAGLRAVLTREHDLEVVAEAGDAREGYAAVALAKPDLVLLDDTLPGPDGFTAARELIKRFPDRHLLVVSTRIEESVVADALAIGANGLYSKHQPVSDLIMAVHATGNGNTYLPPGISAHAIEARRRRGRPGPLGVLSGREREVFGLLVRGFSNEEVAKHLEISRRTVETHRSRILKKLHVHSAVELIRLAARHGLLSA